MRGPLTKIAILAAAVLLAVVIAAAGAAYFVEYPQWDAASASYVYRERPFAVAVAWGTVAVSLILVAVSVVVVSRLDDIRRRLRRR